jgi:hypothetical protein
MIKKEGIEWVAFSQQICTDSHIYYSELTIYLPFEFLNINTLENKFDYKACFVISDTSFSDHFFWFSKLIPWLVSRS